MRSYPIGVASLLILLAGTRAFAAEIDKPEPNQQIQLPLTVTCVATGCATPNRIYAFEFYYLIPGESGTEEADWTLIGSNYGTATSSTTTVLVTISTNLSDDNNPYTGRVRLYEIPQGGSATLQDTQTIVILGSAP
jgi:hypothetical protein